MPKTLHLLLLLFAITPYIAKGQGCDVLIKDARSLAKNLKFDEAVKKVEAAKGCAAQADIDKLYSEIFAGLKKQTVDANKAKDRAEKAEKKAIIEKFRADSIAESNRQQALRAYANDLAYKSQIALQRGDRTMAYRLAEFAKLYVDNSNLISSKSLIDALYVNEYSVVKNYSNARDYREAVINAVVNKDKLFNVFLPWASNLGGHMDRIGCVALSSDGKLVATGSRDETVKIWDIESSKVLHTINYGGLFPKEIGVRTEIYSLLFSPNCKFLAVGAFDAPTLVFNLENGETEFELDVKNVENMAFSPDSKQLVTDDNDKIIIWNLGNDDDESTLTFRINEYHEIQCIAISPDGKQLAGGDDQGVVKIWDLASGKEIKTLNSKDDLVVFSISFSPDGKRLIKMYSNYSVDVIDIKSEKTISTSMNLEGMVRGTISPDGSRIATGLLNGNVEIFDFESRAIVARLVGHIYPIESIAFSPDGKKLVTGGSDDSTVKIWELENLNTIHTLKGCSDYIWSIAFSPDGKTLATGSKDKSVKIWNIGSGKLESTIGDDSHGVNSVNFSPDGKFLVVGYSNNTAKTWNLETRKSILSLKEHSDNVINAIFSPDGKKIATSSNDKTTVIWDSESGKVLDILKGHSGIIHSIAFSPDSKYIATASKDKTVKIWNLIDRTVSLTIEDMSNSIAFSPDGKLLAIGSLEDNNARIWDLATGKISLTLEGHHRPLYCVDFSPDGKRLATGSLDNTARLWDLETGSAAISMIGHSDYIYCIAFSPDGKQLATGSFDKTVKIWDLEPQNIQNQVGLRTPAGLILPQLIAFGLENLLDQQPNNEATLLASGDIWQIAAFADLYTNKIANSLPKKADYERAKRLYQACLSSGVDNGYFGKKLANLEQVWKEKTQ